MSLTTLPKIIVKLSSETIYLDNVSSNNTNYKQITFLNILDFLQEKLQIILPAKSPDSSISKIFSEYSSFFSQSPLEKEQKVSFLLWCVKTKQKKNFLTNIGRSSLNLKKKIMNNSSSNTTTTAPPNSDSNLISNSQLSADNLFATHQEQKGKIKKKMVKMSDNVFSYAGECTNMDQLGQVLSTNEFLSNVEHISDDFLFIELTPAIELSRVCILNQSPTVVCLNETLFNIQQYQKQLEKKDDATCQPICGDLLGKELLNPVKVPYILRVCLKYLRDNKGTKTLGIFREAGSKRRVLEFCKLFNSFMAFPEMYNDLSIEIPQNIGVMVVADLIKHYIRNLPECILTFDKYEEVIELFTDRTPEKTKTLIDKVKLLLIDLPECNRSILSELMSLLHEICCNEENVTLTKMTSKNMGIVIGPNLLFLPSESDTKKLNMEEYQRFSIRTQMKNQQQTIAVVCDFCQFLIENYEAIFKKNSQPIQKDVKSNQKQAPIDTQVEKQELLQKIQEKDQQITQLKKDTYMTLQKEKIIKQLQAENAILSKENKQLKNQIEKLDQEKSEEETEQEEETKPEEESAPSISWTSSLLIISTVVMILYFYFPELFQ